MTVVVNGIEDTGQRYEVRATGYPKPGESAVGWADTVAGAYQITDIMRREPGVTSTSIYDREENKTVITRFGGVLR